MAKYFASNYGYRLAYANFDAINTNKIFYEGVCEMNTKKILSQVMALTAVAAMAANGLALSAFADDTAAYSGGYSVTASAEDTEYKYVYAGLSWEDYWKNENVYLYGKNYTASSDEKDAKGEYDKGAFDTVTRATTNHGLHRGSFQCIAEIIDTDGNAYKVSHWAADGKSFYTTDGTNIAYSRGELTLADGSVKTLDHYVVEGIKYVPVKVAAADYDDFCKKYPVVENGGQLVGGYGEAKLSAYSEIADVTADTNGLKTATKQADGSFTFSERANGTASGIKDTTLRKAEKIDVSVTEAAKAESYGCFIRVDLNGDDYGALGANMQAVKWEYYGSDSTYTNKLATYGTKFAADNWMHKSMGIQLGLTDSIRCKLPSGTDGTGYWKLTVYALGYEDFTTTVEATSDNIVSGTSTAADTTALAEAVKNAEALNESDYTADSWAAMQLELDEARDELAEPHSQAAVDEALSHLTAAIEALVKAPKSVSDAAVTLSTSTYAFDNKAKTPAVTVKLGDSTLVKDTDYTVSYKNNKNIGTATVTVTGIGAYTGTVSKTFTINPAKQNIQKLEARYKGFFADWEQKGSATGYEVQYSTNSSFTSSSIRKLSKNNPDYCTVSGITAGKKYYVRVRSYTVVGGKTYYGAWSSAKSVTTAKYDFTKASVSGISTKAFTGKAITQKITVKANGKTLKSGTDYTVSYSNNKNVGTATVKITGKGSYAGTITKTFKINPAKQEIKKLSAKSKGFSATWVKKGSATGYEVQYSTNSSFKNASKTTITSKNTSSKTVSKLKAKTKYYVRVRSYTTVKGVKYYGAWSTAKTVTTGK